MDTIPYNWQGEKEAIAMHPDLVVIHRSAFFHAMNAGVQIGDRKEEPFPEPLEGKWQALYLAADDHLMLFLGFVGMQSPHTKFLVYSRGTGGGWQEEKYRKDWVAKVEKRFPELKDRITTMFIEDGREGKTFSNPSNITRIRKHVQDILGLPKKTTP